MRYRCLRVRVCGVFELINARMRLTRHRICPPFSPTFQPRGRRRHVPHGNANCILFTAPLLHFSPSLSHPPLPAYLCASPPSTTLTLPSVRLQPLPLLHRPFAAQIRCLAKVLIETLRFKFYLQSQLQLIDAFLPALSQRRDCVTLFASALSRGHTHPHRGQPRGQQPVVTSSP
jgi:hypothetical protein